MALLYEVPDIAEISEALSRFFSYNVRGKGYATIREIADHIHDYASIIGYRFMNKYTISIEIEEDVMEQCMPKMIIQPLVENAVFHRSLANAFAYMNLVEAWGSGIPKLMQAMKEYGLREPEFIDMEVAFRINLYRGQNVVNDLNRDLNDLNHDLVDPKVDLETRLEEVIRKSPELTYKSLGEILAVSAATVKRTMAKMQQEGKIIREGSNRKGKWILTDKK